MNANTEAGRWRGLCIFACLVVAACSQPPASESQADLPATLLTVRQDVGFAFSRLDHIPDLVLHRDGQLFLPGPDGSAPRPTVAEILVANVDADALEELHVLIDRSDLADQPPDGDEDTGLSDVFHYHSAEGVHASAPDPMDRSVVYDEMIEILDTASIGAEPYSGDRLQVIAGYLGTTIEPLTTREPWPLPVEFEEMGEWPLDLRCVVLDPEQTGEVFPLLENSNQGYLWGEGEHSILARMLLPGEEGCVAPEGLRNMPAPTAPPVTR